MPRLPLVLGAYPTGMGPLDEESFMATTAHATITPTQWVDLHPVPAREFLIDQFLLEVGEGRMPGADSPERLAYEDWRTEELDRTRPVIRVRYQGRHRREA